MEIVQDNKSYERACKLIKKQKILYLDTEFLRDKTYWPLLCILQIKTAKKTFIFDFLKKDTFDLSKLKKIFENKKILKPVTWSKAISNYSATIEGVKFDNLTYEQFMIITKYSDDT